MFQNPEDKITHFSSRKKKGKSKLKAVFLILMQMVGFLKVIPHSWFGRAFWVLAECCAEESSHRCLSCQAQGLHLGKSQWPLQDFAGSSDSLC